MMYSSECGTHSSHSRTWAETWCWSQRTQNPADSAWRHQRTWVKRRHWFLQPVPLALRSKRPSHSPAHPVSPAGRQSFSLCSGLWRSACCRTHTDTHVCSSTHTHTDSDQLRGSERPIRIQQSGSTSSKTNCHKRINKNKNMLFPQTACRSIIRSIQPGMPHGETLFWECVSIWVNEGMVRMDSQQRVATLPRSRNSSCLRWVLELSGKTAALIHSVWFNSAGSLSPISLPLSCSHSVKRTFVSMAE